MTRSSSLGNSTPTAASDPIARASRRSDGTLFMDYNPSMRRLALRNADRLSTYSRTDVRVTYATLGHWEFYGEVLNLFNERNYLLTFDVPPTSSGLGGFTSRNNVYTELELSRLRDPFHVLSGQQHMERRLASSDRELVRRMLDGDEEAFSQFFEAAYPALYRFALPRLDHNHDWAGEVAQAALCKAIGKLNTYRGEAALLTWLCTFCRHELHAFGKLNRQHVQVESFEDDPESGPRSNLCAYRRRTTFPPRSIATESRRWSSEPWNICRLTTQTLWNGSTSTK